MKLHLPVRLFRAVMTILEAAIFSVVSLQSVSAYSKGITLGENEDYVVQLVPSAVYTNGLMVSGGAIKGLRSTINISDNGIVEFSKNWANGSYFGPGSYFYPNGTCGGAITLLYGSLCINRNRDVEFSENTVGSTDGATFGGGLALKDSDCTLDDNSRVMFYSNIAQSQSSRAFEGAVGGGIGAYNSTITLSNNEIVNFEKNLAYAVDNNNSGNAAGGGCNVDSGSTIYLSENDNVYFIGNRAISNSGIAYGGAMSICGKAILNKTGYVYFYGNKAISNDSSSTRGGAIYVGMDDGRIELNDNDLVIFDSNVAEKGQGGAIYGDENSTITLSDNGGVVFSRNNAHSGGAIYGVGNSTITLSDNVSVVFSMNNARVGGAIAGDRIEIKGNTRVDFSYNVAKDGGYSAHPCAGAIYGSSILLCNNEYVEFYNNIADLNSSGRGTGVGGGAIEVEGNLSICNNTYVLFAKNVSKHLQSWKLRSITADGGGYVVSLSSSYGNSIEFRDPIYIANGASIILNADYTDEDGLTHKQAGDIIFSAATVETDLRAMKGSAGTVEEILNSRVSIVDTMTDLYGGRLRVEDGAVYKGYGITAHEGSESTVRVKDAALNHAGYNITLNSGTTLELEGTNGITAANLVMQDGSTLRFIMNEETQNEAAMSLTGNLLLNGAVVLTFDATPGVHRLVNLSSGTVTDWSNIVEQIDSGYNYELSYDDTGISLEVRWTEFEWSESCDELTLSSMKYGRANVKDDLMYNAVSVLDGTYQVTGEGSIAVAGVLSVTGGADVTLDLATVAAGVEVGDDSSLSLQKGLNLVSLMTLDDEETEAAKAISVGRNAELSLTDAALLVQVATVDETSAVYYQTEAGDKLLKFTGEMGSSGLNLTLGEDGKTVSATDSAGFTGNITVLSGTTLVNAATTTTDGLAFGDTYATAADKTITVQGGATLDINGRETYYHLVLEKDALLTNSGADTHKDWKGIPVLSLDGDAEVNADAMICMVGGNYAGTYLNLNGHTLTKTGDAQLLLRNTQVNAGTLAIDDGVVRFMGNTSTASGTHVQVNNGGTLWITESTSPYAGTMQIAAGGHVYVGEGPSGILGGDNQTNNQSMNLAGLSEVALAGGTLTFRGTCLSLNSVKVTADSVLEIWDQSGSSGISAEASTITSLDMAANLNLATTWKSTLNIASLTGSGELLVGSSRQVHRVTVGDISGYSGTFAIRGANSTLSLNLSGDDEMNAARVTKDDSAVLILEGSGTYCFSNLENVTAAATGISDIQFGDTWSGKIALRNSVATGMELDDFGGAGKTIVIEGVSGWFAYDRTVESHLQLVESGLILLDTSRKTYTYTGGISGSGDFIIKSKVDNTYTGTYDLSGDLSAWDGAFRVQQSGDNTNTAPVNLNLTGGGTLFSGTDGCGVLMERTGEMNVTIGNAGTATTMRGDIRNVGVTNEGTTTYGILNVTLNNTVDAQGDIIASRINVGAGADINFSGTVQADRWSVGKDASLCLGTGAVVYLSEAPNGVLEGDVQTDDRGTLELTEATVELAGGRLSYRGKNMAMGEVNVTSDSVLEIWDQTGVDGVASHACTIDTLNLNASLEQTTTWKCTLEIGSLTGSGPLTVSSRNEKHYVTLNDLSEYTGTVSISGANTTLTLNMLKDAVVNASLVTKDNTSHLVLKGQGSYNIGTARSLAAGVCFAEDWEGSVRLTGAMAGETLSGLNQEGSWVELFGVSGYLSQADAAAGAQTYGMNLKLTDAGETAAWNLNNGWNGDVRTFTGMVCGTGTLNRNHYKGTDQTLIFAGDVSGWSGALEHNATSATNNGQKVKTNVTFSGSSEINVAMRTNGKGELNVTIDDEHLSAGSKVNINNAVSATNFTVTEGTAARLNSTLQLSGIAELQAAASLQLGSVVTLSAGTEAATMEAISVSDSEIRGTAATSAIRNMHLGDMNGDFSIANVGMHAVEISGSNATLTLANVNLDDTCSINLGSAGSVGFDDSTLGITMTALPLAATDTLHIDCSALLQSSAYGNLELNFNYTAEEMYMRGYQTLSVEFGAAGDYSNLELSLSNAEFKGFVGSIAQFALAPEPATTTLSLLALSALAARRRRR